MASVFKRKSPTTGHVLGYTLQFYDHLGRKHKLYNFSKESTAVVFGENIDALVTYVRNREEPGIQVVRWLSSLPPQVHDKLEEWGLVTARTRPVTLAELIRIFTEGECAKGLKQGTLRNRAGVGRQLTAFFGENILITDITEEAAIRYYDYHRYREATATWGRNLKGVKQFFNYAVKMEWIRRNPFESLRSASAPNQNLRVFVSNETITRLLAYCANSQERLILCLGRYGGLRLPSEIQYMEWRDIDFEHNHFVVKTPKKESDDNQRRGVFSEKATRIVPMFPELRKAFLEYYEDFPESGPERLFSLSESLPPHLRIGTTRKALFLRFKKAMRLAGIPQWGKFFQNMRSTRETELHSLGYSLKDVCEIIGNTPSVAMKHYLQVSVDLIKKASELVTNSDVIGTENLGSNLEPNSEIAS